jgi:hypothetical protein
MSKADDGADADADAEVRLIFFLGCSSILGLLFFKVVVKSSKIVSICGAGTCFAMMDENLGKKRVSEPSMGGHFVCGLLLKEVFREERGSEDSMNVLERG